MIENLKPARRYAQALIPAGSFTLLSRANAQTALRRLHDCLLPEATLLVDVMTGVQYRPGRSGWIGSWVERPDGARIVLSILARLHPEARSMEMLNKYELFDRGQLVRTELEELFQQFYSLDEFTELARMAGFAVEEVAEDFVGTPPTGDSVSLQVVCRRVEQGATNEAGAKP
jgi:hypothetical protein